MDRGWSGYLTLYSRRRTSMPRALPRIDLNMDDLEALYESLSVTL